MSVFARAARADAPKRGLAGLLPKQLELVQDRTSKLIIFVGGYRAGKTTGLVAKAYDLGRRHYPLPVLAVEPTFPMVRSVFVEGALECAERWKMHAQWQESKKLLWLGRKHPVKILCRSADSPRSLEGLTVGSLVGDEWELWPLLALKVGMARVSMGPLQQIALGGTPEGYGPGWELLLKRRDPRTNVIISPTVDNVFVMGANPDYADDMRARLSEEEAAEKLEGLRTMPSGRVYTRFDDARHCGAPCIGTPARLEVWADFNVALMAWAFVLVDDERKAFHVVGQLIGKQTDSQKQSVAAFAWIQNFLERRSGRRPRDSELREMAIPIVCDASGDERSAVTPMTHVMNLRAAGFVPKFGQRNPRIQDRVASVQKVLAQGRLSFDAKAAEYIVRCISMQPMGPDGMPSKDKDLGLDHGADAIGYGIMWHDPGTRPAIAAVEYERSVDWSRDRLRGVRG